MKKPRPLPRGRGETGEKPAYPLHHTAPSLNARSDSGGPHSDERLERGQGKVDILR
jgi:hypothetical protein